MARDSDGQPLFSAREVQARSWCLSGAVACESEFFEQWDFPTHFPSQARQISELGQSVHRRGFDNSVRYNNSLTRTQEDILRLLREAIRNYEADR